MTKAICQQSLKGHSLGKDECFESLNYWRDNSGRSLFQTRVIAALVLFFYTF